MEALREGELREDVDVIASSPSFAGDYALKSCVQPSVPVEHVLPEALRITSVLIQPAGTFHKALKADRLGA